MDTKEPKETSEEELLAIASDPLIILFFYQNLSHLLFTKSNSLAFKPFYLQF